MRTRNAWKRWVLGCLAALLPAVAPAAAARDGEALHLRLMREAGAPQPWSIGIYGESPEHCPPSLQRVALDGADLSIMLHVPRTGCGAARPVPFLLKAAPPASSPLLGGTVYRVRVYSDAKGTSALAAFRLLDTGSPSVAEPENGFWWSIADDDAAPPSRSTGLTVESQGDRLALGLYGFDDAGAPAWYFGSTRLTGRVARVQLLELAGGDPLFSPAGTQPSAQDGPRIELEFVSPARARAWLVRNVDGYDVAVRALTVARSRFAAQPAAIGSGRWVFVADDEGTPLQFEFSSPSRESADRVRVDDPAHDAVLECNGSGGEDALPQRCSLLFGGSELATFERVGLDRLVGKRYDGATARLLRITTRP